MKEQKLRHLPWKQKLALIFLSLGGIGFIPWAPGTWGTLATLPLLYFFATYQISLLWLIPFFFLLFILACLLADSMQKKLHTHDPGWIVIDELLGMFTAWCFFPTAHLGHLTLLFILFRFFDIIKFWPASYLDQKIKNGLGTISDDIVSGVYAGLSHLFFLALWQKFFL